MPIMMKYYFLSEFQGMTNTPRSTCEKYLVSANSASLPAKDFADTAMADPELSGDVTGPDPLVRELHYSLPHNIR